MLDLDGNGWQQSGGQGGPLVEPPLLVRSVAAGERIFRRRCLVSSVFKCRLGDRSSEGKRGWTACVASVR